MGQMDQAQNANLKMEILSWDIFRQFGMESVPHPLLKITGEKYLRDIPNGIPKSSYRKMQEFYVPSPEGLPYKAFSWWHLLAGFVTSNVAWQLGIERELIEIVTDFMD